MGTIDLVLKWYFSLDFHHFSLEHFAILENKRKRGEIDVPCHP